MKEPKLFIYTLLITLVIGFQFTTSAQTKRDPKRCDGFTFTIEKSDSKPTLNQGGTLEITVKGATGKVRYFVMNKAGHMINEQDLFQHSFMALPADTYTIIVSDSKGCTSDKEVKIQ